LLRAGENWKARKKTMLFWHKDKFFVGRWCLFCRDWREAFLFSWSYGMGDPMVPSVSEGNSEGGGTARRSCEPSGEAGGHHPSVTP
jgi:hypothetical protein